MTHIAFRFIAATALFSGIFAAPLSWAASLGPPSGTYMFGLWETGGCDASANGDVYSLTFNMPDEGGTTFASSLMRSDGKGAVKFSISLPLHFQILGESATWDYFLGGWVVMTFETPTSGTLGFQDITSNGGPNLFYGHPLRFYHYFQIYDFRGDRHWSFGFQVDFPDCRNVTFGSDFVQ